MNLTYENKYKKIELSPWTGKNKIQIQKMGKENIKSVLVYDSMITKEFISEEEVNYILIYLRNSSISEDFSFDWICN